MRVHKHILLSAILAGSAALSGCGSKTSDAAAAVADGNSHSCQPAVANQALSDAISTQCDGGNPKPPAYVPNLPAPPPAKPSRSCTTDHFTQSGSVASRKLDVLFVMDTSSRMGHRWTEIAEHLEHFTNHLEGVDLRFAVILAHVDEHQGHLWAAHGQPLVLDSKKLTMKQIRDSLYRTFWDGASSFDDRGLGEAGFYSLHQLMTRNADEAKKLGFLRADAGLTVLFQSDEQEIGSPVPHHLPHGIRPRCDDYYPPIVKKEFYDDKGVNLNSTFAAVRAVKGNLPVSMNAFVNVDEEDMDHYLPLPGHSDGHWCVFASPGYGYFEMVAKTGGVLRSVHEEPEENLDRLGRATHDGLLLQHDFPLSHPAKEVDPTSIHSTVDGGLTPHTYSSATDAVHLDYAGKVGSKIDIAYCQPQDEGSWSLTGFGGSTTQTAASLTWQTTQLATSGKIFWGTSPNSLTQETDDSAVATSHAVTVNGLTRNTTYYFQAASADDFGTEKRSAVIALTTQPVPPPAWTLSGFSGTANQTAVSLSFATSEYATIGHVLFGLSPSSLTQTTAADASPVKVHAYAVTGLSPNTTYYFQAVATDDHGQTKQSPVIAITTQPVPPPGWTLTAFTGSSTQTTVSLTFATSEYATTGQILFGTSPSNLSQTSAPDQSPVTAHAFTVTGLTPNTTYYFQAEATDDQGQTKESAVIAITTQPIPLPVWSLDNFAGTPAQTSVALSFATAAYATTGKVFYGTSPNGLTQATAADASPEKAHSYAVSGLAPNTTYYFQAVAVDDHGQSKQSSVIAVTTLPIPPPVWSLDNFAGSSTQTTATLSFTTSAYATTGQVLWGTSADNLNQVAGPDASPATSHSFTVSGLTPNTTYFFQAVASDDHGQTKQSTVISVTTQPIPLPVWSLDGFAGTTTQTTATLTFATSAYATTGRILYGTSAGTLNQTSTPDSSPVTAHSITVSGLTPNTTYFFQAVASDDHGQTKQSALISLTTQPVPPPVWSISGFAGTPGQNSVALSFATSDYATTGHVIYGTSASNLNQTTANDPAPALNHAFTANGLTPNTTYFFQAVASDDHGQTQQSAVISITTLPLPPPVWTLDNFAGSSTQTTATLTFTTSAYATTGQVLWGTTAGNLSQVAGPDASPATSHSFTVSGLTPNTTYFFQAVASDDHGQTKQSAVISVTTQPIPLPVWSISGFAGTAGQNSVALSFATSQYATTGHVVYGTSASNLNQTTASDAAPALNHSFAVSGLTPNTTYFFQAVASDDRGQTKQSAVISVTTQAAPGWAISGFDGTTTGTTASLIWQTGSVATKGTVHVGLSASDLSFLTLEVPNFATSQVVTVNGLSPNTTYFFQVTATDANGTSQTSGLISKTTKASRP